MNSLRGTARLLLGGLLWILAGRTAWAADYVYGAEFWFVANQDTIHVLRLAPVINEVPKESSALSIIWKSDSGNLTPLNPSGSTIPNELTSILRDSKIQSNIKTPSRLIKYLNNNISELTQNGQMGMTSLYIRRLQIGVVPNRDAYKWFLGKLNNSPDKDIKASLHDLSVVGDVPMYFSQSGLEKLKPAFDEQWSLALASWKELLTPTKTKPDHPAAAVPDTTGNGAQMGNGKTGFLRIWPVAVGVVLALGLFAGFIWLAMSVRSMSKDFKKTKQDNKEHYESHIRSLKYKIEDIGSELSKIKGSLKPTDEQSSAPPPDVEVIRDCSSELEEIRKSLADHERVVSDLRQELQKSHPIVTSHATEIGELKVKLESEEKKRRDPLYRRNRQDRAAVGSAAGKAVIKEGRYLWQRFADFLPFRKIDEKISLGEGNTALMAGDDTLRQFAGIEGLWLKNETQNPTWSFKDRGSLTCIAMAREMAEPITATISTGNMGHSMAAYGARAGIRVLVFVPDYTPEEKLLAMAVHGAHIIKVTAPDYSAMKRQILAMAAATGLRIVSGNGPLRVEGYKLTAFELVEQMQFNVPDYIAVPTSACGHIRGLFKGYMELFRAGAISRLPKMIVVQAANNSPIVSAIKAGKKHVMPFRHIKTVAEAITTGDPPGGDEIIHKAGEYGWPAEAVTEEEILLSQKRLADSGFLVEPAAATSLYAVKKLRAQGLIEKEAEVVLMLTGSGLKDMHILKQHPSNIYTATLSNVGTTIQNIMDPVGAKQCKQVQKP